MAHKDAYCLCVVKMLDDEVQTPSMQFHDLSPSCHKL